MARVRLPVHNGWFIAGVNDSQCLQISYFAETSYNTTTYNFTQGEEDGLTYTCAYYIEGTLDYAGEAKYNATTEVKYIEIVG